MSSIQKNNVLIAVSEYGELNEMFRLAKEIRQELFLHPIFVFSSQFSILKDQTQLLELEKFSWIQLGTSHFSYYTDDDAKSDNGYFQVQQTINKSLKEYKHPFYKKYKQLLFIGLIFLIYFYNRILTKLKNKHKNFLYRKKPLYKRYHYFLSQINQADKIFQIFKPKLVISGQDYALSVTSILAKVAEKHNIHTAIIPFSMPPTMKEIIESFSYFGMNKLMQLEKLFYEIALPQWINKYHGSFYSRLDPYSCYISNRLDLSPPKPWLPNSGRGIVFLPSQWSYNYYIKSGIPASQLKVTGALWNDILWKNTNDQKKEGRRKNLLNCVDSEQKGRKKSENSKIIIVSWPPNQYPRKAFNNDDYQQLCEELCKTLNSLRKIFHVSIVISLHPTLQDSFLLKILKKYNLYVIRDSLLNYIDLADIFISTVSSVNFWSLSCCIPTLNFDCYGYGYAEFEEAGAIDVRTMTELFNACFNLLDNEQEFALVKEAICKKSQPFIMKDGCSRKRILSELKQLMAS